MKKLFFLSGLVAILFGSSAFVSVKQSNDIKVAVASPDQFAKFLSHFEKVELPFEVELEDFEKYQDLKNNKRGALQAQKKHRSNLAVFRQFIPELKMKRMSRLGPPEVLPVARYYPTDKMVAVVYMSFHPFMEDNVDFSLVLFELNGRPIKTNRNNELTFNGNSYNLGYNSMDHSMTFSIDSDGIITQQEYKGVWEKDLKKHGFENNERIGYELIHTQNVQLLANGFLKELNDVVVGGRP